MYRGALILGCAIALAACSACGGGGNKSGTTPLKELHDPKTAPTATPPARLPTPLAAFRTPGAGGAAGSQSETYVVKAGDTLGGIAAALGIPVDDLARANGITDPARIAVGQPLKVPRAGVAQATATPSSTPSTGPRLATPGPAETAASGGAQIPPTGGAPSGSPIPGNSPVATATAAGTATRSAPAATGTTAASAATQYTVKAGDSACAISIANGISVQELADANGLTKDQINRLSVGQLLKIPARTGNKGC